MNSGHAQSELFEPTALVLPEGMRYAPEFLTRAEEESLAALVQSLPLHEMNYKGYTARRRVASYGGSYDFDANRLRQADALPVSLEPLREKVAAWLGVAPSAFTQALVAEYRPGTPLGWHRDVPDFEDIAGVSLLGEATMRLRPWPPREPKKGDVLKLPLEPRSIYLLRGPSRWAWQHSVAATHTLRYSITFRTSRPR